MHVCTVEEKLTRTVALNLKHGCRVGFSMIPIPERKMIEQGESRLGVEFKSV